MSNVSAVLDTLQYAKRLKSAGFTEQQAEAQAEALVGIIDDKLVTKSGYIKLGERGSARHCQSQS